MWTLLVDFGLVVLIWMTQLVVYPSFSYYSKADLRSWHQRYTLAISFIVMPLMLGQLVVHGVAIWQDYTWIKVPAAILIVLAWIHTFFYAVPLHRKIGIGEDVRASAKALQNINWYRTFLWSVVFLLGLFDYVKI